MEIRVEQERDHTAVEATQDAAFGGDRRIVPLVRRLRTSPGSISLVATVDGRVAGHVLLSHAWVDTAPRLVDVLTLSPLGVHPQHQRQGLGTALVAAALAAARVPLVFLEGDPAYYSRLGFAPAVPLGFRPPTHRLDNPGFQVARLAGHEGITGSYVYRDVFWELDCVGIRH